MQAICHIKQAEKQALLCIRSIIVDDDLVLRIIVVHMTFGLCIRSIFPLHYVNACNKLSTSYPPVFQKLVDNTLLAF